MIDEENIVAPREVAVAAPDKEALPVMEVALEAGETCGANLEYDPAFQAMEAAARGKPEQQVGEEILPAEEPDWRLLRELAQGLLERTTDLRVLAHLACARTRLEGFGGLAGSLSTLREVLEEHWEGVHPLLDPSDDRDPTMRVNALLSLADPESMLRAVREAPLAESPIGRASLADLQTAAEEPRDEGEPAPARSKAQVEAAFAASDVDTLRERAAAVARSLEALAAMEALLFERVGPDRAPDLGPLSALLEEARAVLSAHLPSAAGDTAAAGPGARPADGGGPGAVDGDVRGRDDVVRLLDRVCDYYERCEPSSPVPLLLGRAKRLVAKDFMQIIRDVAPDGVQQITTLAGAESPEEPEE